VIKNRCQRCEVEIEPGREVWLELDQRTNTYTDEGTVPEEHSQGGFPFGADCAARSLREHKAKTPRTAKWKGEL
jgi:hypothetical protein